VAERRAQSPAFNVEKIKVPVMLAHGGKDVRVPIQNMDELISHMAKVGKKPEIVVEEPKEPHGFQLPEHNISLYEKMLAFFDKYIGPGAQH
jgi:dipeptidyl aminopeptidase/acylaminoacyl peptidase